MSNNKDNEYSYDKFLSDSGDDYPKYSDGIVLKPKITKASLDEDCDHGYVNPIGKCSKFKLRNKKEPTDNAKKT
jgi:hypothetical protein